MLYLGTVVTGSGPHAGDLDVPRNGLDPLLLSQLHADFVFLLVGLTVALVIVHPSRATWTLLGVELAQGLIGFVQYFTDLPVVLVGFHLLGAALIAAVATWMVIAVSGPVSGAGSSPRRASRCDGMWPVAAASTRRADAPDGIPSRWSRSRRGDPPAGRWLRQQPSPSRSSRSSPSCPRTSAPPCPQSCARDSSRTPTTPTTGNPTAACSMRSPDDAATKVRAVVTWVQLNEEYSADEVLDSQCRSIDPQEFRMQDGFTRRGGRTARVPAAARSREPTRPSMAALTDREVITVRLDYEPKGKQPAMTAGKQMLEGVISSMAGNS